MQNLDKTSASGSVEMRCFATCEEPDFEESEQLVVFELVVPVAAKVPPLSQPVAVAKIVQQASVTSTVPSQLHTQLRANNTALNSAWCVTATLVASREPTHLSTRY